MKKEVAPFNTDSVPGFLCVCMHACVCVCVCSALLLQSLCSLWRKSHGAGRDKMQVSFFTSSTWFVPEQV